MTTKIAQLGKANKHEIIVYQLTYVAKKKNYDHKQLGQSTWTSIINLADYLIISNTAMSSISHVNAQTIYTRILPIAAKTLRSRELMQPTLIFLIRTNENVNDENELLKWQKC
jgi:hypothetical protein